MRIENDVAHFDGDLTIAQARQAEDGIEAILRSGVGVVNLAELRSVDSSAIGLLLACRRRARASGRSIDFLNVPESLISLARLYGVGDLVAG